jgi:hypothetical protein
MMRDTTELHEIIGDLNVLTLRMRAKNNRHAESYYGGDVVWATTVDGWADEIGDLIERLTGHSAL